MSKMLVSIIIRTYNESEHLEDLLIAISKQELNSINVETIIVDSGSTDGTLEIAKKYKTRIIYIKKEDFSFGRSLNYGFKEANGDVCVIISGHCIPKENNWLIRLLDPVINNQVEYAYGAQIGGNKSRYSECKLFNKYYPETSKVPQEDLFLQQCKLCLVKVNMGALSF